MAMSWGSWLFWITQLSLIFSGLIFRFQLPNKANGNRILGDNSYWKSRPWSVRCLKIWAVLSLFASASDSLIIRLALSAILFGGLIIDDRNLARSKTEANQDPA